MEVYLDNSATTRCSERAKDLMVKVLMEDLYSLIRFLMRFDIQVPA